MLNLFFLLIYFAGSSFLSGTDLYVLLTIHFGILAGQQIFRKKIAITPLTIYYIGVIIANIANISFISQVLGHKELKIYAYIVPKYIDQAAQIWCIYSTLYAVGYEFYKNKSFPSIFVEINTLRALTTLFYILLALNLLQIYGFVIGRSQFGKMVGLLNSIGILFYARLWAAHGSKVFRNYAIILYALLTYFSLISSYLRFELILPTFYITVGYFVGKGEIKYLFTYRVLPFLIIVFIYSSNFRKLQNNRTNFLNTFTQAANKDPEEKAAEQKGGGFLDRSSNIAQMTNVVNLVEKNGIYNGTASSPLITALIPRFLWPDKPKIQLGSWFAYVIGAGYKNDQGYINNSVNMTVPGELYLDFGWIGVILGSIFFGGFISILWNSTHFYDSVYNLTGTIFGGYIMMLSIGSYADLQIVVTLISTYLIFFAIKKLAKFR